MLLLEQQGTGNEGAAREMNVDSEASKTILRWLGKHIFAASFFAVVAFSAAAQSTEDYLAEITARDYTSDNLVSAAQELKIYAKDGGVGIIVSYMPWEGGHTAEKIADAFIQKFRQNSTEADFRVVLNDVPGASIIFVVGETAQGPFSPNDAWSMVPDIAAQNRIAHGL